MNPAGARRAASLLLAACLIAGAQPAQAGGLAFSARFQELVTRAPDSAGREGWSSLSRLRLQADAGGPANRFDWRLHLAWDAEALWGAAARDPRLAARFDAPLPTWLDADALIRPAPGAPAAWRARHSLYRGWLRLEGEAGRHRFRLDLGRQRIAWGSGRFWNPTDRFNPVAPTALEPDWKAGADAISLEASMPGGQGSLRLVHAPGRAVRSVRRKSVLRWRDTFGETDIALMIGRIGAERIAGADVTGNLGEATARLEWMQAQGGAEGGWGQVAAGADGVWSSRVFPAGLYLAIEYFHNGAAGRPARHADRLSSRARHLLALAAGYDLTPLFRLELSTILDPARGGWFAQPSLRWSAADAADVSFVAQRAAGPAGSDFHAGGVTLLLRLDYWLR